MSWPQACITPTSAPTSSFTFFVEAYASCVFSTTGNASMSVRIINRGPGPFSRMPTTPYPPMPVVTLQPTAHGAVARVSAVCCS